MYFNFSRLINKYQSGVQAIIFLEGYYDECGDWVQGEKAESIIYGAVIGHKESKVYRSDGKLTMQDKRLFTLEPVPNALYGSKVVYEGSLYSLEDTVENAKFTGVYAYTLKYVSAFKETRVDVDITDTVEDLEERLDGVYVDGEESEYNEIKQMSEDLEERLDGTLSGVMLT